MASINVSEADFGTLVGAVMRAHVKGDFADALALDKLARKVNAAVTMAKNGRVPKGFRSAKALTWRDVPSPLATFRGVITPRPVKASRGRGLGRADELESRLRSSPAARARARVSLAGLQARGAAREVGMHRTLAPAPEAASGCDLGGVRAWTGDHQAAK